MPQIAAIAEGTVAGARVALAEGADDVPDVQTEFDIGKIERDLGWTPELSLKDGLISYSEAISQDRFV